MKVYAKQINPEYQESPLFIYGIEFQYKDSLIMPGNRYFKAHNVDFPAWEHITRYFDEMANEWNNDGAYYEYDPETRRYVIQYSKRVYTVAEILKDYGFSRPDGKPWTNKQKHAFRLLMENDDHNSEDEEIFLPLLKLLTGYEWETHTIRGCCQSDWADVITRADVFTKEALEYFEMEYFNLGSEWMIHDEENEPEEAEDVSGYCTYCHGWNTEMIRSEIANIAGCEPEEVTLFAHAGTSFHDVYSEV